MIGISVAPRRRLRASPPSGAPDVVAPVVSGMTLDETTWVFGFESDEVGACHWLVDTNSGFANADALVAAKPAAPLSGNSLAMIGSNSGLVDTSALSDGTWTLHVGVIDAAGNASNVLSTSFALATVSNVLELSGDPLEWNGDQLIFNAA